MNKFTSIINIVAFHLGGRAVLHQRTLRDWLQYVMGFKVVSKPSIKVMASEE